MKTLRTALVVALALTLPAFAAAQGRIVIYNNNAANVGFNDLTPAVPVGGNPGTTLGQQRLNVFLKAAEIWEARIHPKVDVNVLSSFANLGANVLGSAGTLFIFANFPGAELPNTWYHSALANQLAGIDLQPCPPGPVTNACFDLQARFSIQFPFYMGFDNNEPPGTTDLLPVVLHELGHGLGFANFVDETTGTLAGGRPDVYSEYTLDVTTGEGWNQMTDAERKASAINVRKVSWSGLEVNRNVSRVLVPGEPSVAVLDPAALGLFPLGDASFGARLTATGVTGQVAAGAPANGCTPLTNPAAIAGKIALLDRGVCTFVVKVKNAQDAGAIAVLIADNVQSSPPPGLGGSDPAITITSGRITLSDGTRLKSAFAGGPVTVRMNLDTSVLAGADRVQGLMMLAALDPVAPGSSISHYEAVASPNQLMEPAINGDLVNQLEPPRDLTVPLMTDIGWFSDKDGVPDGKDACLASDIRATVQLGACDSGVANTVFTSGCSISDLIGRTCSTGANHGAYVSCVAGVTNQLKASGAITGANKGAIQSCAAKNK